MRIDAFEWDEHNLFHAIRHGISKEEIEEVVVKAYLIRRGGSGVYVAYGQTLDGRYVLAVFEYKGHGLVRPFSARPMTRNEKKMFREQMK